MQPELPAGLAMSPEQPGADVPPHVQVQGGSTCGSSWRCFRASFDPHRDTVTPRVTLECPCPAAAATSVPAARGRGCPCSSLIANKFLAFSCPNRSYFYSKSFQNRNQQHPRASTQPWGCRTGWGTGLGTGHRGDKPLLTLCQPLQGPPVRAGTPRAG